MSRQADKARWFGLTYGSPGPIGQNTPGLDGTDPADWDALDHADHHGLMQDDDDHPTAGIYERAGFNSDTSVGAAFRNPCMIEAGSMMLAESDDSYLEV